MAEPWIEEEIRQKRWDAWLKTRPECSNCGHPITANTLTVLGEKLYCPGCVADNTYFVEDLEF